MDEWIERLKWNWTWVGGLVAVLAIIGVFVLEPSVRASVNENQGAISAILTVMLVVLYFGQYRLQSQQFRVQNASHVEIQEYATDGQKLEVWLSNLGNGVATDIELETHIYFDATDNFAPGSASTRLRRVDEDGDYKRRVGNSLEAGEHNVRFVGEPITEITPDGPSGGHGLVSATNRLACEDVDEVSFTFFVKSQDLLGSEDREGVFMTPYTVELEGGGMNIEEIKQNPKRIGSREVV